MLLDDVHFTCSKNQCCYSSKLDTEFYEININSADDITGCLYEGTKVDSLGNPDIDGFYHNWIQNNLCFKDDKLREMIYNNVFSDSGFYTGKTKWEKAVKINMRKLLYGFTDEIKVAKQGIKSIEGIQYLIHAKTVDNHVI